MYLYRMKISAEIINIGDELLIGQIVNTNAAWMAGQLNEAGVPVVRMTTTSDTEEGIIQALSRAIQENSIVLITGGLGPTKDDITKMTLCKYFGTELVFNTSVFDHLDAFFKSRGREFSEANQTQCYLPANCQVLMNKWGTAPGMLFENDGKMIVSMPGVPSEMKNLMTHYVIDLIRKKYVLAPILHRSFLIEGIPESILMKTIEDWENNLPSSIKLAYLPSSGLVKLRLTSLNEDGKAAEMIAEESRKLHEIIGNDIFGYEEDTLESVIKTLLEKKGQTLTAAESCTGGYLAHKLTSVPGISKVFPGSFVTYDYWVKSEILGVKEETWKTHGAVSREVVEEMAICAKNKMKTDYAIALSGIAGPDGGTPEKPVGTVWIAWATPNEVISKRFQFPSDRAGNIHASYLKALSILRQIMLGLPLKKEFWEKDH